MISAASIRTGYGCPSACCWPSRKCSCRAFTLLWLAIAAILTGILTYTLDLSLTMQVIDFAIISLILVFSVKRFLKDSPIISSDPLLNNRGGRLIGQTATVTDAFVSGEGRVHQGDSDWSARGPDMAVGERVRITALEGTVLRVEPLNLIEASDAAEAKAEALAPDRPDAAKD